MPGEVMYKDVVTLSQNGTAHDKSVGMGHGKGWWLVVPALTSEGKPEPVYDGLMIKFLSGVCKTIYFPEPYVRMLLKRNLTPTKAWI